jgi:hypothetical protein
MRVWSMTHRLLCSPAMTPPDRGPLMQRTPVESVLAGVSHGARSLAWDAPEKSSFDGLRSR